MTKLLFMGLMLTNKGIGPTEEKGKAVVNQRQENQNALEVRSFLGLDNYNVQFIPDFATIPEPFCNLSKKGVCFRFGDEQRRAFNELKNRLPSAETLGYFDKDARTLIIADLMHAQLALAQYLFKNNKEVRELSVMQAKIWVKWKNGILKLRKKHWQMFGCAIVSICTCTALNLNYTQITSH